MIYISYEKYSYGEYLFIDLISLANPFEFRNVVYCMMLPCINAALCFNHWPWILDILYFHFWIHYLVTNVQCMYEIASVKESPVLVLRVICLYVLYGECCIDEKFKLVVFIIIKRLNLSSLYYLHVQYYVIA